MNLLKQIEQEQIEKLSAGKDIPDFAPGDTLIVNVKVREGDRTRVQAYEGLCIGRSGGAVATGVGLMARGALLAKNAAA